MSVLVTGASGFIGGNVVRMLVEGGKEVVAFDTNLPGPQSVLADMISKVKFVAGNITDMSYLLNTAKEHNVEGIFHLAALLRSACNLRPVEGMRTNIEGTANVLEVARMLNVRRVVCATCGSATGSLMDMSKPTKETDYALPIQGIYGLTKLVSEQLCFNYRQIYDVDAVAVRGRGIYGPGYFHALTEPLPIDILIQDAVAGKPINVAKAGDTSFEYTYVKDYVRCMLLAYEAKELKDWLFNASFSQLRSIFQVVDVLRGIFPKLPIEVGHGDWEDMVHGYYKGKKARRSLRPPADISRAHDELGWEPQYDIERGIPANVAWLKERKYL